jgi:hypothetical protein
VVNSAELFFWTAAIENGLLLRRQIAFKNIVCSRDTTVGNEN